MIINPKLAFELVVKTHLAKSNQVLYELTHCGRIVEKPSILKGFSGRSWLRVETSKAQTSTGTYYTCIETLATC